ncbi:MAG: hypothetical protein LBE70_03865 [Nitrososphaerota archaeon]|nr:hypothetical protein [Nitrososphaerota archaeon]
MKEYSSTYNTKQLQQKLVQILEEMNRKTTYFEEVSIPTIPNSEIIFEFGIATGEKIDFLTNKETNMTLNILRDKTSLDFFCAIRYYKNDTEKKIPLKFDYYMFRTNFTAKTIEFRVFHKQGPRYITPEELVTMIINKINKTSAKKILCENTHGTFE